jgi:hypothetical protein
VPDVATAAEAMAIAATSAVKIFRMIFTSTSVGSLQNSNRPQRAKVRIFW